MISTHLIEKLEKFLDKECCSTTVNYILEKLANRKAITIKNVTIEKDSGFEIIEITKAVVVEMYQEFLIENASSSNEEVKKSKRFSILFNYLTKSIFLDEEESSEFKESSEKMETSKDNSNEASDDLMVSLFSFILFKFIGNTF